MDTVGVILVVLCTLASFFAARTAFEMFQRFGTSFYRYLTIALCCFTLMPLGYLFPLLILDPNRNVEVLVGSLSLNIWAYGGLSCLVAAVENLKEKPNTFVIDISFILAGLVVAGRFLPTYQQLVWNGQDWEIIFGMPMILLLGAYFIYVTLSILPFLLLLWYRIKRGGSFGYKERMLYLGTILCVIYAGILMLVNHSQFTSQVPFLHHLSYLAFIMCGTLLLRTLLRRSPTIFFSTTEDLLYLGIVRSRDNESILGYRFPRQDREILSYLVTGVHSTLNTILQEAIQSSEELKHIRMGHDVITVVKGKRVTGFVISDREIDIINPLLVFTLDLFENKYGHEILARHDFPEFKAEIEQIFQFALQSREVPRWLNIPGFLRRKK